MLTRRQWEDLLYTLGLFGQDWLYVDRVAEAYLTWTTEGAATNRHGTEGWGPVTEEKVRELLSRAALPETHQRLIVDLLHHVVCPEDFPMPTLAKNKLTCPSSASPRPPVMNHD